MANRNLLHRSKLGEFKLWLNENGFNTIDNPAMYQALSWKVSGGPMPIIFDGKSIEHFSCNEASIPYVDSFIRYNKEQKSKTTFTEKVYEIVFGNTAVNKYYTEEDILNKLKELLENYR